MHQYYSLELFEVKPDPADNALSAGRRPLQPAVRRGSQGGFEFQLRTGGLVFDTTKRYHYCRTYRAAACLLISSLPSPLPDTLCKIAIVSSFGVDYWQIIFHQIQGVRYHMRRQKKFTRVIMSTSYTTLRPFHNSDNMNLILT